MAGKPYLVVASSRLYHPRLRVGWRSQARCLAPSLCYVQLKLYYEITGTQVKNKKCLGLSGWPFGHFLNPWRKDTYHLEVFSEYVRWLRNLFELRKYLTGLVVCDIIQLLKGQDLVAVTQCLDNASVFPINLHSIRISRRRRILQIIYLSEFRNMTPGSVLPKASPSFEGLHRVAKERVINLVTKKGSVYDNA